MTWTVPTTAAGFTTVILIFPNGNAPPINAPNMLAQDWRAG